VSILGTAVAVERKMHWLQDLLLLLLLLLHCC
jgi:hypothetical protein